MSDLWDIQIQTDTDRQIDQRTKEGDYHEPNWVNSGSKNVYSRRVLGSYFETLQHFLTYFLKTKDWQNVKNMTMFLRGGIVFSKQYYFDFCYIEEIDSKILEKFRQ